MIESKLTVSGLNELDRFLKNSPAMLNKATNQALNKAIQKTRTYTSSLIRSDLNLKARLLRDNLKISRSTRKTLRAKISVSVSSPSLNQFAAKKTKRGITLKITKSGGRKLYKKAFFIQSKNGRLVAKRTGTGRDDIQFPVGPSIDQSFTLLKDKIRTFASAELKRLINQQLKFVLKAV